MEYSFGTYLGLMNIGACEFHQALQKGRRQAFFYQILSRPCCLTPFDVVKTGLNPVARLEKGRQEIRLDQISGSVGKSDFLLVHSGRSTLVLKTDGSASMSLWWVRTGIRRSKCIR